MVEPPTKGITLTNWPIWTINCWRSFIRGLRANWEVTWRPLAIKWRGTLPRPWNNRLRIISPQTQISQTNLLCWETTEGQTLFRTLPIALPRQPIRFTTNNKFKNLSSIPTVRSIVIRAPRIVTRLTSCSFKILLLRWWMQLNRAKTEGSSFKIRKLKKINTLSVRTLPSSYQERKKKSRSWTNKTQTMPTWTSLLSWSRSCETWSKDKNKTPMSSHPITRSITFRSQIPWGMMRMKWMS